MHKMDGQSGQMGTNYCDYKFIILFIFIIIFMWRNTGGKFIIVVCFMTIARGILYCSIGYLAARLRQQSGMTSLVIYKIHRCMAGWQLPNST